MIQNFPIMVIINLSLSLCLMTMGVGKETVKGIAKYLRGDLIIKKKGKLWTFSKIGGGMKKIARRTIGAKGCKSDKAIIRFQKFERRLNEIRIQF